MSLPTLSYDTWEKGHRALDIGGEVLDGFLAALAIEAPPVALILKIAAATLGWALSKIWDALPHEWPNDKLKSFKWAQLHSPGTIFPVQDPRWMVKTNNNTLILDRTIGELTKNKTLQDSSANISPPLDVIMPSIPVARANTSSYVGVHLFSPASILREDYTTLNQVRKPGLNPTFGRVGF